MNNWTTVPTARGAVPASSLGRTLIHEHLFVKTSEIEATGFDRYWNEEAEIAHAVDKLEQLKADGIDTLVDCTVPGLGRDIRAIAKLAERTDINIVVATGLYSVGALQFYFAFRGPGTPLPGPDPIDALIAREIEHGIDGTGIRPAFIKVTMETPDVDDQLARPLAAAARVHAATGVPIQVHTDVTRETGIAAIKILNRYGADLSRVVFAHSGDSNDLDYIGRILDAGALVGFDRFAHDLFNTTEDKIATLELLLERGYARQVVLSHDAHAFNDAVPFPGDQALHAEMFPGFGWTFVPTQLVPRLKADGISDTTIETMLVHNPRRFFTGETE